MLYSRWHNLGHEFHGSYRLSGRSVLIKEWHDLNGFRMFMGKFPASEVVCYEFFTHNEVKLDLHNRMWSRKPFALTTTKCIVEIDGKVASPTQVVNLIHSIDQRLAIGARYLERLTTTDLKIINAEMEFYAIKELLKESSQPLSPPMVLIKTIRHNVLSSKQRQVLNILSACYRKVTPVNLITQFDPSVRFH